MEKLDKLDSKIISELDIDARRPISIIARKVRASREVVNYRIKVLNNKGIISGTQTFFNPSKEGYTVYRVLVRLDSLDEKVINNFQNYFISSEKVMWFAKLGGKWDYVMEFFAKNADEFNKILQELTNTFGGFIRMQETITLLEIFGYNRKYIDAGRKRGSCFKIGGKIENVRLDKIDKAIIKELKANAQVSNFSIGEKLKISRNTVKYRIKKLEDLGLILGYRLFFHPQKIGYNSYKLLIEMKNMNPEKEKEFFYYAQYHPNIVFAHRNLGKWNYEFEIEIQDLNQLQEIIIELRTSFRDLILDYELFPILHDFKINLFPEI